MHKRTVLFPVFLAALLAFVLNNCSLTTQTVVRAMQVGPGIVTRRAPGVINVDGDVSMTEQLNRIYWNPHCVGLTKASNWKVTFNNEVEISMKTTVNDAGHVAAGTWWTTSFEPKQKLQLYASKPLSLQASFKANVVVAKCTTGHEWLRIALACAIQRANGSVVYTEMDFYDSPRVLTCPSGNISRGGNLVYKGGDVIEYKMAQAGLAKWTNFSFDLTKPVNQGWSLKPGDMLESVYIVVEVIGQTTVTVRVDDLWITLLG